jgi:hypothetical protein
MKCVGAAKLHPRLPSNPTASAATTRRLSLLRKFHDNVIGTRDVLQPTTLLRYFNTYSSFFHMLSKSPRILSPAHAHALPDDEQLGVSRSASPFAISRLLATHHIICPMLCPLSSLFPSATMATGANPSLALRSFPSNFHGHCSQPEMLCGSFIPVANMLSPCYL